LLYFFDQWLCKHQRGANNAAGSTRSQSTLVSALVKTKERAIETTATPLRSRGSVWRPRRITALEKIANADRRSAETDANEK
jgi:hypothetical protein